VTLWLAQSVYMVSMVVAMVTSHFVRIFLFCFSQRGVHLCSRLAVLTN
jgi:hypothetical protein